MTLIRACPRAKAVPAQISRLLHAHEIILKEARAMAAAGAEDGTTERTICWSAT